MEFFENFSLRELVIGTAVLLGIYSGIVIIRLARLSRPRPPEPSWRQDPTLFGQQVVKSGIEAELAAALHLDLPGGPGVDAERQILDSFRVIPLVHAFETAAVHPRVHGFVVTPWGQWVLDNAWLEAPASKEPR